MKNAIFSIFFEGGSLPPGCFLIGLPQKIGKIHDHGTTPDVQIPGLLHDLLVDGGSVGPHDNAPLLVIDLCIQQGVPDQINDPPLGVLLIHGKLMAERIQINLVTNPAIILKDKNPGLLHEQGGLLAEKKIRGEDGLALGQLPMRLLEIELDAEAIDDGVGVIAVLHDPHQILHEPAHP